MSDDPSASAFNKAGATTDLTPFLNPKPPPGDGPIRVYADGVFDMFHAGHANALKQAKQMFGDRTYLICGVASDAETHAIKGPTVMNEEERGEMARHCKWVDEVICPCPWLVTLEFCEEHNIDFVMHGDDLIVLDDGTNLYQPIMDAGKFVVVRRTPGLSTSDIIRRILRERDMYVARSLKRGFTPEQLNLSVAERAKFGLQTVTGKVRESLSGLLTSVTGKDSKSDSADGEQADGEQADGEAGGEGGVDPAEAKAEVEEANGVGVEAIGVDTGVKVAAGAL